MTSRDACIDYDQDDTPSEGICVACGKYRIPIDPDGLCVQCEAGQ